MSELRAILFFWQAWSVLVGIIAIVVTAFLDQPFQFKTVWEILTGLLIGSGLTFVVVGYLFLLLNLVRVIHRGLREWLHLNGNRTPTTR